MERAGRVSHILWQTHDPFLCGFIILCERLRVSKGTALCGESHLKLHYGHASAQITGEKSLHREWITHVCPVRPHLSEWVTHVCPDVRSHLSEWITHVCPDVRPHLFENLLYKVYMIVFTCFFPTLSMKWGYSAQSGTKRTSEGQSTTVRVNWGSVDLPLAF